MRLQATVGGRTLAIELRPRPGGYGVWIDGRPAEADLVETGDGFTSLLLEGRSYELRVEVAEDATVVDCASGGRVRVALASGAAVVGASARGGSGPARVTAPMPGRVVRVLVGPGDVVDAGQGLLVVEAMKMQNELRSPRKGRVQQVAVREGQAVETGALLVVVT